ncbi:TPA: ORF6N domain-containing protein [Candidatus Woesearchaeota archaeon]|nr:ORF6N domain-containing protein [Candidatus Woesearchaeota archaeon]HIH31432.1 ORF6N domain-containing protein [Candidatus Woesearchaeota archaeon]HIH55307.1 ORF6N domain-containing protein [Candidatus Woesearchaeota archaeon]HIJ01284.1 ORF6N domain-containing protein [Candidatus Woesearchaeota archaeon]HIJ13689.1 ORF6N domain-containing protein [Candidatus Woesearchaeota archaeon]
MKSIAPLSNIRDKIHLIRGRQVILDRDLAELYGVKSVRLREQVKRNIKRFPSDFMFKLTDKEVDLMVSQNAIPSRMHLGGYLPFAFTEQGVANLSSVLTNDKAIQVNIQIMRAFVFMRKFIAANADIFHRLDRVEVKQVEHDRKFDEIFDAIQSKDIKLDKGIFFDGQVFDAYKFVSDIIKTANHSIILIDNYIDDSVLTLFSKRSTNVKVTIYTKEINKRLSLDLKKYNSQYPFIEIRKFNKSHDRFLIIDDKRIYHFGASLKDLGKKWFAFSKFDKEAIEILERLK